MVRSGEMAYNYIRDKILSGHYHPAQRLIESQLAEEIGVSRNTVRKALLQIEKERLVVIENNKGATVTSLELNEILQYYEIRCALEVLIIKKAVKRIDEVQLKHLSSEYEKMTTLCEKKDYDNYSKENQRFHETIYEAANSPIAADMIRSIKTQLRRFQIKTMLVPDRAQQSLAEHKRLLDALQTRNEQAAVDAIVTHMANVENTIKKYMDIFY